MAIRQSKESSSWLSESKLSSETQLHLRGVTYTVDKRLLVAKSSKLSILFEKNPRADVSRFLQEIPSAGPETFELVARFCHGFELHMSAANVIPLSCLASSLGMTESHSPNNLLAQAFAFFQEKILPSWNGSIAALRSTEHVFQDARRLGLVDACLGSIAAKALADPHLLGGEPACDENEYRPNARKRLFVLEPRQNEEQLTALPLHLYENLIRAVINRGPPTAYVAASLYGYLKKWPRREVIEAVVRLMPQERGVLPCSVLSEMLHFALVLEASGECTSELELRLGKQLDRATVKDLLLPSLGSGKHIRSNIECVRRILRGFYRNYDRPDDSGIVAVADLIEGLLAELARASDLDAGAFVELAEMSNAAVLETERSSDGIYKAIDIYLDKHKWLTASEREEVCRMLDCDKMSEEARKHAARNERLPTRVAVQVLSAGHMRLKDTIIKERKGAAVASSAEAIEEEEEEVEEAETARMICGGEEEVRMEMEQIGNKVMELERECCMMRREINEGLCQRVKKREKNLSLWGVMKRKLNCKTSFDGCKCQVKPKKMRVTQRKQSNT